LKITRLYNRLEKTDENKTNTVKGNTLTKTPKTHKNTHKALIKNIKKAY